MASRKLAFRFAAAALAAGLAFRGEVAVAHGSLPRDVPIDRLVKNLDARLAKSPDDADLHYILGRLHALAFETGSEDVRVWMRRYQSGDGDLGDDWRPIEPANLDQPPHSEPRAVDPAVEARLRSHLKEALVHLNRAIELAPEIARYHLALASILETGVTRAGEVDVSPCCPVKGAEPIQERSSVFADFQKLETDPVPSARLLFWIRLIRFGWGRSVRDDIVTLLDAKRRAAPAGLSAGERRLLLEDWKEQIAAQFFIALALALPSDSDKDSQPIFTFQDSRKWLAHEAAEAYVRVVTARDARPEDTIRLAVAKTVIDAFAHLPPSRIRTPIVFSPDRARPLSDLLDPSTTTSFDLDGSGVPQAWTWIARDTALLCWDPTRSGRITSGRQLFGSVSWWLFFANGYDALDALDDDRDGKLTGAELRGLAAWFDRNGNGISDSGEVIPIEELGIVELSCRATDHVGESPCNHSGLRLASGAVLPTYDWVAHAAPEPTR
jgi:hypothetical protein